MKDVSFGWCPDLPDPRDYIPVFSRRRFMPNSVDLRENEFGTFVEASEHFVDMSCSVSLMRMLDWQSRKWTGHRINGAPKFLHDLAVHVWGGGGHCGVGLRNVLKTLKRFGVPPGRLTVEADQEANCLQRPECFGYSKDYCDLEYFRLDSRWEAPLDRLNAMKICLADGNPFLLGFTVPSTISRRSTVIPLDANRGGTAGGTACVVMGFDDLLSVSVHIDGLQQCVIHSETGAFLVWTCWGTDWGKEEFLWLPYAYVELSFAGDAWAVQGVQP